MEMELYLQTLQDYCKHSAYSLVPRRPVGSAWLKVGPELIAETSQSCSFVVESLSKHDVRILFPGELYRAERTDLAYSDRMACGHFGNPSVTLSPQTTDVDHTSCLGVGARHIPSTDSCMVHLTALVEPRIDWVSRTLYMVKDGPMYLTSCLIG